jgi:hypothetical protein
MSARDELARDIIQYVMANDILTQHGMAGLRQRLAAAIPDDIELMYEAMLKRIAQLMDAQAGTRDGLALDILSSGVEAYEAKHFSFSPQDDKRAP